MSASKPPPAARGDPLLTAEQLADRWQVPKAHVYALSRRDVIPVVRLGKYYRYRLDAIEAFELGEHDGTMDARQVGPGRRLAIAPRP